MLLALIASLFATVFPFAISQGPAAGSAADVSALTTGPAGAHGFVRVEGGRLLTSAGELRLSGANLTGPGNFPSKPDAVKLAEKLMRFGINAVRLHYMDPVGEYANFMMSGEPCLCARGTNDLDFAFMPEQLDKLEFLVAELKKRGIYIDLNLHVGRFHKRLGHRKGETLYNPELIASQKDLTLVAEVKNGREAVAAVERLRPDVAVLDLLMPQMDGIEATARIRETSPATQVVILTSYGTSDGLSRALANGAIGAVLKSETENELVLAIRRHVGDLLGDVLDVRALLHPVGCEGIHAGDRELDGRALDLDGDRRRGDLGEHRGGRAANRIGGGDRRRADRPHERRRTDLHLY